MPCLLICKDIDGMIVGNLNEISDIVADCKRIEYHLDVVIGLVGEKKTNEILLP